MHRQEYVPGAVYVQNMYSFKREFSLEVHKIKSNLDLIHESNG